MLKFHSQLKRIEAKSVKVMNNNMKRKLSNQNGAILIMTVLLIIVYIGLAALFVDGFRMYETKQQIDSFAEYQTESLNKWITEFKKSNGICQKDCKVDFANCMQQQQQNQDCTAYLDGCTSKCNINHPIITSENFNNNTKFETFKTNIKIDSNNSFNKLIGKSGGDDQYNCDYYEHCEEDASGTRPQGIRCQLNYKIDTNQFLFAQIWGKEQEFIINDCVVSCYNENLASNYIFPYYFEKCSESASSS